MKRLTVCSFLVAILIVFFSLQVEADVLTFNSLTPDYNSTTRANWLSAVGITTPQYLVDFESEFKPNDNISGITGLFPYNMVITDTSTAHQAIIRSGSGVINSSNPVGTFSVTQNELAYLELYFPNPVDYVAFQDIDQAGTDFIITLEDGATFTGKLETTGSSGDTAEFFGIYRNDKSRIVKIELDASGTAPWGIDTIEYGVLSTVPEPTTLLLLGLGLIGMAGVRRLRK